MIKEFENGPYPQTLEKFILTETARDIQMLNAISTEVLSDDDESPESVAFNNAIKEYVTTELNDFDPSQEMVIPDNISIIAQTWLKRAVRTRVLDEYSDQYIESKAAGTMELLKDKVIEFKSLTDLGFGMADGRSIESGPDDTKIVVGKVVYFNPTSTEFWVQTREDIPEYVYIVRLWDCEWGTGELSQNAEMRILPE